MTDDFDFIENEQIQLFAIAGLSLLTAKLLSMLFVITDSLSIVFGALSIVFTLLYLYFPYLSVSFIPPLRHKIFSFLGLTFMFLALNMFFAASIVYALFAGALILKIGVRRFL